MPTWPADLPQYAAPEQYRELPAMPVAEVEMDAGAPKTFGTGSDDGRVFQFTMNLNGDQVQSLDAFYRTDLRDGETEFDWVLPREQTAVRFAFLARPRYQHTDGDIYQVSVLLESRDVTKTFGFRSQSTSAMTAQIKVGATFGFAMSTGSNLDFELG